MSMFKVAAMLVACTGANSAPEDKESKLSQSFASAFQMEPPKLMTTGDLPTATNGACPAPGKQLKGSPAFLDGCYMNTTRTQERNEATGEEAQHYLYMWKHACAFTKWVPSNQFMYSGLDYDDSTMTLERFGFIGMDKRCFWGSIGVLWKRPLPVEQILPNTTVQVAPPPPKPATQEGQLVNRQSDPKANICLGVVGGDKLNSVTRVLQYSKLQGLPKGKRGSKLGSWRKKTKAFCQQQCDKNPKCLTYIFAEGTAHMYTGTCELYDKHLVAGDGNTGWSTYNQAAGKKTTLIGARIQLQKCSAKKDDTWSFTYGGTWKHKKSGLCVSVDKTNNGAPVYMKKCAGGFDQMWNTKDITDDFFQIESLENHKCIDLGGFKGIVGLQAQLWQCRTKDFASDNMEYKWK